MKKWMSFALAVALFATTVLGGAFAESALDTMAEESGLYVEASVSAPASQDTEEDASCSDLESPVEELPELQLPTGYDDEPVVLPEAVEAESTDSASSSSETVRFIECASASVRTGSPDTNSIASRIAPRFSTDASLPAPKSPCILSQPGGTYKQENVAFFQNRCAVRRVEPGASGRA